MRKLPDWIYLQLEQLYFEQRNIRRKESARLADEQEERQRAYFDRLRAAHHAGTCVEGCPYVPCIRPVDGRRLPPPCEAECTEHRSHYWNGQPVLVEEA